ncbi:potassium transporter Kef [Saccharobesus litoralis]|uniref:Potassium transporter Kef n=1 Tax=Saccharobesus litoralis TaxID=2172099 RepID=A0A2S0VL81_9ALTE|nr:ion channel [Saccharobesus litoralis]AWB64961.1 potassium transporter Kef [Saccharobesus litoralis]
MNQTDKFGRCQFHASDGTYCNEVDMGNGYCFWHDPNFDKTGMELADKLERYAKSGGITQGLQLKKANLSGINLVNRGSTAGFDFSGSDFYRANLSGSHLFNIKLNNGSLMKANLSDANLHCAKLLGTNLLGVKLHNAKIDNIELGKELQQEVLAHKAESKKDRTAALDNFEQAEEIYRDVRKAAENQGLFELAGHCIHKELTMRRKRMPLFSGRRIFSKIVDLFCGYGERPLNVILFSLGLILACAFLYFSLGVNFAGEVIQFSSANSTSENINAFFSTLYFSVVTFTTLGYGDITPLGLARLVAAFEAFVGSFTIALFVVVFVKKMTR